MKLKLYKKAYIISMLLFFAFALLFGLFCFYHNYLPEGLVVIASVLVIITVFFVIITTNDNTFYKMSILAAGSQKLILDCVYYVDGNVHGDSCALYICEHGILIETKNATLSHFSWAELTNKKSTTYEISLSINDILYRFVCNNSLKVKATYDMISNVVTNAA